MSLHDILQRTDLENLVSTTHKHPVEELTQADYETLANLRYVVRRFTSFSKGAAEAAGLPPQQHQALLAIVGNAGGVPMTIGALSERLLIAPHSATELVSRLAQAELVTRVEDVADRRRQMVSVTPKARDLLRSLSASHLAELRTLAPDLIKLLESLSTTGPGK
jgi:DNA-binding MarR family transcriptional regulator